MKFYKVVAERDGNYYSALDSHSNRSIRCIKGKLIKYKVNDWTYPEIQGSLLYVFADVEEAKRFLAGKTEVWECEVTKPRKNPPIMHFLSDPNTMWKLKRQKRKYLNMVEVASLFERPKSVHGVTSLKLIKKVEN